MYYIPLAITVFTTFKPILFVSLEKSASWSGLRLSFGVGLGLAKVVGCTAIKPLKLLVSLEKSASCPFHCSKTACVVHFT